jgi:thiamine-phosphate pyrophosphorylase
LKFPVLPRLYAILDVDLAERRGLSPDQLFDIWIDAGVRLVQLRAKSMASDQMLELAQRLARRAQSAGATLIVNDRADIAKLAGAAGVHLGQDDLAPKDARLLLPASALIGVSTHSDDQLSRALDESVDYLAIGPVFATTTKAKPDPVVGLDGVRRAAVVTRSSGRPLVAIGGITLARAADVLAAGASSVAVISDLLLGDPDERARQFLRATGSQGS